MEVRFDRAALSDIDEITNYIAARNPKAAANLLGKFDAAAQLLQQSAEIGAPTSRAEMRRLVVANYLVVYQILADEIIIQYVRHGARKRPWEND